ALKRAAVKFGIGRYLYRLPSQWVDYDPQKRQFARTPTLPPSALPKPKKAAAKNGPPMPANGVELQRRVHDYDARLAQQGVCQAGELVKHIVQAGVKSGYEADLATWSGSAIVLAVEEARAFESRLRQQKSERKEVA
ncbi:MAG: Rad52/Rad22 family DNA repair protein, partial [Gemmataceae bacterium]